MSRRSDESWFHAGLNAWSLGAEASLVAGMRLARMAVGGTQAVGEARLMVREKVEAAFELQSELLAAGATLTPLGATTRTLHHYRTKVAANKRRLSR